MKYYFIAIPCSSLKPFVWNQKRKGCTQ